MRGNKPNDTVYRAYERRRREKRREYQPVPPGPNDLTVEKILERMNRIYVGDRITFDSMKACDTSAQCDRNSSTIVYTGTVVEHCGGYLMVKLHKLIETVTYFDIIAVNNKKWPWYIRKDSQPEIQVLGDNSLWRS